MWLRIQVWRCRLYVRGVVDRHQAYGREKIAWLLISIDVTGSMVDCRLMHTNSILDIHLRLCAFPYNSLECAA